MECFRIGAGIAIVSDSRTGLHIVDETGQKRIVSTLISELVALIHQDLHGEDELVEALEGRFSLNQIYYSLIQLEKQGTIVRNTTRPESPEDLFRAKVYGQERAGHIQRGITGMSVRILAIGETDASAVALAESLSRSELLRAEYIADRDETNTDAIYIVVTPDYLEPELGKFGHYAYKQGLRWLPVKLCGVAPWIGPLFIPGETGCIECLLDRVRGHRRLEAEQIRVTEKRRSLRLSMGQTVHSFDVVSGLLALELEKQATNGVSELTGGVITLDFRTLKLERHRLVKRPQCPVCSNLPKKNIRHDTVPKEPLQLQSQTKADYHDGGERICSAVETLQKYTHLVSPITGIVGQLTQLANVPACFGRVIGSRWIVRRDGEIIQNGHNGRFFATGYSAGKGKSEAQARAGALGEAIERYSTQYEGYEHHIHASFLELGDMAIHPYELMGFSERQYRDRDSLRKKGGTAYVPDPYDATRPIDWTPAWSLTQKRWRLVPSAFVYYSYPKEGGGDVCNGCSNGVAAGNCIEEAIMQGFFELVERDATAMWWYHKLRKPIVDWRSFDLPFLETVDAAMDKIGLKLEVLDLTNDLGIPVFSANLFDGNDDCRFRAIGLGCHNDPRIALERAVLELGQSWRLADRDKYSLKFQNTPCSREQFLQADPHQIPKTSFDFTKKQIHDFLDEIENTVQLLHEKGLEMFVVDLTRPDIGFPVVRVVVPGMAHFWPRFGCRRLFEVPRAAGWVGSDICEDDLNPVPFFL